MKRLILPLIALALLLSACGYMVEDPPVQIGKSVVYITPEPD